MKKIYVLLLGIVIFGFNAVGQLPGGTADFDIQIAETSQGYVVIQIRANHNETVPASPQTTIEKLQFGIKWNREIVAGNKLDITFVCNTDGYNPYQLKTEDPPNSVPHNSGSWDFRNFELTAEGVGQSLPYGPWIEDHWYDIAFLRVFRRTPGNQVLPEGKFYIMQANDPFIIDPPRKGFAPEFSLKVKNNAPIDNYIMNVIVDPNPFYELPVPTNTDVQFIWQGGAEGWVNDVYYDQWSWNYGPNWLNGCDGEPSQYPPTEIDDCIIPSGCGWYPKYSHPTYCGDSVAKCNNLDLLTDPHETNVAKILWMPEEINYTDPERALLRVYGDLTNRTNSLISISKMGTLEVGDQETYDLLGPWDPVTETGYKSDLSIQGSSLLINSQGYVRVLMDTDINGNEAIKIMSSNEGPGNFKNFGDISYAAGGSVSIETFMKNDAYIFPVGGGYYYHTVGPTVSSNDYYGAGTGTALQNFDLDILQTFAYQWQEPAGNWLNVYPYLYPIPTATGLLLSDTTGNDNTFKQTGQMLTGEISIELTHTSGNPYPDYEYLQLISNPYPCAINWDELYAHNSSVVGSKIYIYNAEYPAWGSYNATNQESVNDVIGLIQVGQGFFVETLGSGEFTFTDDDKIFSDAPLRSGSESQGSLRIVINGGNGSSDDMVIHFMDEATSGYDELYDTKDWGSYYADATQINSPVEDKQLSVTSLPFLYDQIINVPVNVICAKADSYSLTFSNLESFTNVDIWLEDTYAQGEWVKITAENSTYMFFQSPELQNNRFIVHFNAAYLPNAIDEAQEELIKVYSSVNDVYIINNSTEVVKEISVFNLMGQEIMRTQVPQQNNYKLKLNEPTGYYVVRVRTNKSVYSEKVLIMSN